MFENRLRVQERIRDMTELMEEIRKRIVFFDGGTREAFCRQMD